MPKSPAAATPRLLTGVPGPRRTAWLAVLIGCSALLGLSGCNGGGRWQQNQLIQRQEQLELQVQQLEQRLNRLPQVSPGTSGRNAPAGVVKSLTYRSGTSDDRLRIYWADGRVSDLPCTKEQNTLVCG